MTVAVIILAAGGSSRYGSPKSLAPWEGGTLLSRAIATATPVGVPLAVLGYEAEQIKQAFSETLFVINGDWKTGLSSSIACGVRFALASLEDLEAVILLPVDQPLVTSSHLERLSSQALASRQCIFTRDGGEWGPPAAVPSDLFKTMESLAGDKGLKSVIRPGNYSFCDAPGMLADVDTPADLKRLQESSKRSE